MTDHKTDAKDETSWRMRTYPIVVLVALLGAMVLATVTYDRDHPTSRLGGDYPAFYGAGAVVLDGDWDELYSGERQQIEQTGLIDDDGGFLYFSYPPVVAGAYGVLAGLGYQWSFLVHTILMGLALYGAIRLLWPWLERLGLTRSALLVVALAFYPVLRAIPGGQNTTLGLLLVAAAIRLDHDGHSFWAGAAAAMLLFKPQFGLVIVALMIVARRWRMLGGWSLGALAIYTTSAVLMGGEWIADWWEQASAFRDLNLEANGTNFVSLPGFLENVFGSDSGFAWVLGYGLAAALGAAVAYYWWKHPVDRALRRWSLAAAAVVIAAPQTLYYDTGLLLLGLVVFVSMAPPRAGVVVGAMAALSWTQLASSALGWSPLGPIAWVATALLLRYVNRARQTPR